MNHPPVPEHAKLTYRLLKAGLRPLPMGNSLPVIINRTRHFTIGPYEGEPRLAQKVLAKPELQDWVPQWVDVVVELWVGSIDQLGQRAQLQRDNLLWEIQARWSTPRKQAIVGAFEREGLKGVRDQLRPFIVGPMPKLIEEFEAEVARLGRG